MCACFDGAVARRAYCWYCCCVDVVVTVATIVLVGGIVVFFVIICIVVLGCRRTCSSFGSCVVEVIESRVCAVALPSNLSRYSKSWCFVFVGSVRVVFAL